MQTPSARWLIAGMAIVFGVAAKSESARSQDRIVAQAGTEAAPVIAPPPARVTPRRPASTTLASRSQAAPRAAPAPALPRDDASARNGRSGENAARLQRMARWRVVLVEHGDAHWYGHFHQGRLTASGERFDLNGLTAAHRDLPLGSYARVTDLRSGRAVIVRINDRLGAGPPVMIDLARGAASELGMVSRGVAAVRIEALVPP
jgi:rare lipoprotein A